MIDRLSQYIEFKKLSIRSFEAKINASDGMIRRAIKNNTDIQSKWLAAIADNFHDINIEWLVTGRGEMLRTEIDGNSAATKIVYQSDPRDAEILAANKVTIETQKETIETQRELISTLKQRINDLERGSSYSKTSAFHTVQSADTSNPSQTGGKAKRPNK